jgi:3-methyl-2-oxobutanoate hydroxymethyltransferase
MKEARVTVPALGRMKRDGEKIAMLTAYDYPTAIIADTSGIDVVLVGDSLGTVVQGHDTTLPVTLDHMVYHTSIVSRACRRALLVADLPFGTYQTGVRDTIAAACRLIKEGGAHSVKLEGGRHVAEQIRALADSDIPVMGHIGLTPQSVHRMGGYRVQGRGAAARERLLADARAVEESGAFALVLEGIPRDLAVEITASVRMPTIGIGAGLACDGQVLVIHDLLGLSDEVPPKFARQYVSLMDVSRRAVRMYVEDVRNQKFPADHESY